MGKNLLKISIVVLSLLLIPSTSSATELIQNGGFEAGALPPWEKIGGNNSWTVSDDQALQGMYCGLVEGADQLRQSFEPRLGSSVEVLSVAVMAAMGGTYPTLEIHYSDQAAPTLVSIFIPVAFRWYAFDFLDQIDPDREVSALVLAGHPSGSSSYHRRTWFDAVTLQNNSDEDPADQTEMFPAELKRLKVHFNLKKPRTHLSLAVRANEVPEGIHAGPAVIRVLISQDGLTTEFEAEAELVDVPHGKDHIIRLMDEGSAKKQKCKK